MEYNVFEEARLLAQQPDETDSAQWGAAKRFLYELKLPAAWAQICLVACALTDRPVMKIWLLIECVNGLRRQSGRWDTSLASELLEEVKRRIDALDDTNPTLRRRLTELWCYHSGWVFHPAGKFQQASGCHRKALQFSRESGDVRAQALAKYNAFYEYMHFWIMGGDLDVQRYFDEYCRLADATLEALSAGTDDDIRWRANIACHLAFFRWVVSGVIDVEGALEAIGSLDKKTKPAFSEAAMVLEALQNLESNPERAAEIASSIDPSGQIDWRSYAMYIRALALAKAGKSAEADAVFTETDTLPDRENGGHLVAALIRRRKK